MHHIYIYIYIYKTLGEFICYLKGLLKLTGPCLKNCRAVCQTKLFINYWIFFSITDYKAIKKLNIKNTTNKKIFSKYLVNMPIKNVPGKNNPGINPEIFQEGMLFSFVKGSINKFIFCTAKRNHQGIIFYLISQLLSL